MSAQGRPELAGWARELPIDPLPALLSSGDQALRYFVLRDLLGQDSGPAEALWGLPEPLKIVKKQQGDGSWRYPGRNRDRFPATNHDLLETFRRLGLLVNKYGFDQGHAAVRQAAEYIFSCQTDEGDIRGILGTQYMPYYHGVISELLIKAGFGDDPRVEKGLAWLLAMRQDDGGWIVPAQALTAGDKTPELWSAPPVPPDRALPFSHLATGMVLRAFAVHPRGRQLPEIRAAATLLKSRFLHSDAYGDRKAPHYWTKFQFPFWWTNLLTGLDTLSELGFSPSDEDVQRALQWFAGHQQENGLWRTSYEQKKPPEMAAREREAVLWVALATCRVLNKLYGGGESYPPAPNL